MIDAAFLQACAPQMPPAVSYAIVRTESSFRPYAIGVNRSAGLDLLPPPNLAVMVGESL